MRSFVRARVESGEYITPHPINDELRETVGVIHSLDRDNFPPAALTSTRFETGAWGGILVEGKDEEVAIVHAAASTEGRVFQIPDTVSGGVVIPWIEEIVTGDCMLDVALSCQIGDTVDELEWFFWAGVRVDGVLIARSPMQTEGTYKSDAYVEFQVAVGAGPHILEPVYGCRRDVAGTLRFFDRILRARELAR